MVGLIMGYLDQDLYKYLENENPRSLEEKLALMNGIMSGIRLIHKSSIMHRDIKPQNIMIRDGKPIIIDFGESKLI
jgi:serine/threonine protein kinase